MRKPTYVVRQPTKYIPNPRTRAHAQLTIAKQNLPRTKRTECPVTSVLMVHIAFLRLALSVWISIEDRLDWRSRACPVLLNIRPLLTIRPSQYMCKRNKTQSAKLRNPQPSH